MKEAALTAGEDLHNPVVQEVLQKKLLEISTLHNVPKVIQDVTHKYMKNTDYMKFIVFFSNLTHMEEKQGDVIKWFQTAYPNHCVNTLEVSSRRKDTSSNVHKLRDLKPRSAAIDLIFCVDMLNMGYHVNDLTGIVMYRCTSSSIIYSQQLGRALSAGAKNPCMVFDIVDNLHRKAIYCLNEAGDESQRKSLPKKKMLEQIDVYNMSKEELKAMREKAVEDLSPHQKQWWKFCNHITPQDLIITGHEAEYREIIAKAIAESVAIRCKRAQADHRRRWCQLNKTPYPGTAQELLSRNLNPPLRPFAKVHNVTVSQVVEDLVNRGVLIDTAKKNGIAIPAY